MSILSGPGFREITRIGHGLAILVFFGSLTGCGYTLLGDPSGASVPAVTLAVGTFTNRTHEPGLENRVTAALRQAVLQSHAFRLSAQGVSSHRLQGIVREIRTVPLSFDANDTVLQYRIEADIRIHLTTGEPQKAVLEQDIVAWAEYLVSRTRIVREEVVAREAALARLAEQFASKCTALLTISLL
jgi:hypothetical protein